MSAENNKEDVSYQGLLPDMSIANARREGHSRDGQHVEEAAGALAFQAEGGLDMRPAQASLGAQMAANVMRQRIIETRAAPRPRLELHDAFTFLDLVKAEFAEQPEVYNEFLRIMRLFKNQRIDTAGVISGVTSLFKGRRQLIEGFNAFLPRSYKIHVPVPPEAELRQMPAAQQYNLPSTADEPPQRPGLAQPIVLPPPQPAAAPPAQALPQISVAPPPSASPAASQPQSAPQLPAAFTRRSSASSSSGPQKRNPEFAHAVNYVKKIKTRFTNEPEVYKTFLEILHTYQRDQRPIREVYSQVSLLFRNHTDLLEEFSQFLPDPQRPEQRRRPRRSSPEPPPVEKRPRTDDRVEQSPEEQAFFEQVSAFLGSRQLYSEFLRCLNLYSQEHISADELVNMVRGFIGQNEKLFSWFTRYIGCEKPRPKPAPVLNLSTCKRLGSYRLLPRAFCGAVCSGRTPLCREVLNDQLVSCPSFNSEDSTFVASKKNIYEEALFRCEDERYELDLLIDSIQSLIQILEPVSRRLDEITTLPAGFGGTAEAVYMRVLRKIYSDRAMTVAEALRTNPRVAVPVVLSRLKQKDLEWRKAQREWQRVWRSIQSKNYSRALDHLGSVLRNNDRKAFMTRSLVHEIETAAAEAKRVRLQKTSEVALDTDGSARSGEPAAEAGQLPLAHLEFEMTNMQLLCDLHKLFKTNIERSQTLGSSEKRSSCKLLDGFFPEFFGYASQLSAGTSIGTEERPQGRAETSLKLYGNASLYGLLRLFQIAYTRLAQIKASADQARVSSRPERVNKVAQALRIQPSEEEEQPLDFATFLELLDNVLDGALDPAIFEDKIRTIYGLEAYLATTIEKLVQSFIRQLSAAVADQTVVTLVQLFDWTIGQGSRDTSDHTLQQAAETICGPGQLFRMESTGCKFRLWLVEQCSSDRSVDASWAAYVSAFVQGEPDVKRLAGQPRLFLKRTRADRPLEGLAVSYNLECKICVNTYKMFFVENTEDFLWNPQSVGADKSRYRAKRPNLPSLQ